MKTFLVAVGLVLAVTAVNSLPYGTGDDYAMVPDGEGNFKLVNVNVDPEPESFFDATADTVFLLFTPSNRDVGQVLQLENVESLTSSTFNPAFPVRFIVHGWQSNEHSDVNIMIRRAYLALGNFNVIVVDWSAGAETINYIAARNRVAPVGAVLAQLVQMISRQYPAVSPRDITIVGHSLGAHIAGFAGKNLVGDMRLGAVVALDAALPLFSFDLPAERVSDEDAIYVESIHTNAGLLGFDRPIGDSNFYPNFGSSQPGCGVDLAGSCAHSRAVDFMAESITTNRHFWSRQCGSYQQILEQNCVAAGLDRKMGGEPIDLDARGIYWLTTNRASPFATGLV